jgi:hypothetical protein
VQRRTRSRGSEGEALTRGSSRWWTGRRRWLRQQVIGGEGVAEVGREVARDLLEVEARLEKDRAWHSAVSLCGGR